MGRKLSMNKEGEPKIEKVLGKGSRNKYRALKLLEDIFTCVSQWV